MNDPLTDRVHNAGGERLRRVHLLVGALAGAAFLGTGLYMHFALGHLSGLEDFPRALYRSGHIYLLFAALLNLTLGAYVVDARSPARRNMQLAGSALLLASPVLFLYGFMVETPLASIDRPWTFWSIIAAAVGVVLHVCASGRAAVPARARQPERTERRGEKAGR